MRAFHRITILAALLAAAPVAAQVEESPSLGDELGDDINDPEPLVDEEDIELPRDGELVPGTSTSSDAFDSGAGTLDTGPGLLDDDELDPLGEPPEDEDFSGDVDPLPGDEPEDEL